MSFDAKIDRDSLQKLLANAFEVQESQIPHQVLADLVELQRLMSTPDFDLGLVFEKIVHSARKVAGADGAAIALLEANELIYRAGSGRSSPSVGRHLVAVLSAESNRRRREILRVEDADFDVRIEGAISRQFDAKSLLMLSIYEDCKMAGVIQILFSAPHTFRDREVFVYRLLADLVEDAILRKRQFTLEEFSRDKASAVVSADQSASLLERVAVSDNGSRLPGQTVGVGQVCSANSTASHLSFQVHPPVDARITRDVGVEPGRLRWRRIAATVTLAAITTSWAAYHRLSISPEASVQSQNTTPAALETPKQPVTTHSHRKPSTQVNAGLAPSPAFKRLQVGKNEVDYIADDVTIRHFLSKYDRSGLRTSTEVNVGPDVTVRYFHDTDSHLQRSMNQPPTEQYSLHKSR